MFTGSGCFPTLMLYAGHPASRSLGSSLYPRLFWSTEITCCPPSEVIRWEDLILQCPQDRWNFFCLFSLHTKYTNIRTWSTIYMPLYDTVCGFSRPLHILHFHKCHSLASTTGVRNILSIAQSWGLSLMPSWRGCYLFDKDLWTWKATYLGSSKDRNYIPGWHVWRQGTVVEQSQIEQVHFPTKFLKARILFWIKKQDLVWRSVWIAIKSLSLSYAMQWCPQILIDFVFKVIHSLAESKMSANPAVWGLKRMVLEVADRLHFWPLRPREQFVLLCLHFTSDFLPLHHHHHLFFFSGDSGPVLCACISGEARTDVDDFKSDFFPS